MSHTRLDTIGKWFCIYCILLLCSACSSLNENLSNKGQAVVGSWCSQGAQENARDIAAAHCLSFQEQPYYQRMVRDFPNGCTYIYRCATPEVIEAEKIAEQNAQKQSQARMAKLGAEWRKEEEKRQKAAQHAIDNEDNATCVSYGLAKGTDSYAACRVRLRELRVAQKKQEQQAQEQQDAQQQALAIQQQQIHAQQEAEQSARWQNFTNSLQNTATWMQGRNPNQPSGSINCTTYNTGLPNVTTSCTTH